MRKLILILFCTLYMVACSSKTDIPQSKKNEAVQYFKTQEQQVHDSTWTNDRTLAVGVYDDGTKKDGYALYVCQKLADMGIHDVRVRVVDIQKLVQDNKWINLGTASCDW
jgi:uncharacterized protein YceK